MKIVKIILASLIFVNIPTVGALEEELTEQQKKDTKENNVLQQSQLSEWQEHMLQLLGKGILWDFGNNVPTNDWKNTALEIAQKAIDQNSSLADQIKTSFISTINDKIELENGLHSIFTTKLITEFNRQIDEWLDPKAEIVENNQQTTEEIPLEIQPTEDTVVSIVEDTSTPELVSASFDTQENKEQIVAEREWTDYLQNLAQQEYDSSNIDDLISKAHKLAQETVMPGQSSDQQNRIDTLKKEFKAAIELQSKTKGFGGVNPDAIIAEFNKKLEESIVQQPIQPDEPILSATEQLMMSDASRTTSSINNIGQEAKQPIIKDIPTIPSSTKSPRVNSKATASDVISEYITVPHYEASFDQTTFEKEQEEIARQKSLKEAVVTQIKQKAEFDAEKKEKQTLIASLMEKIFHVDIDNWFNSDEKKPTIESVPEIIETILSTERDITKRTNKKNAYMQFQTTLLSFNNKIFWDSKNNRPLQSWVDKIKTELAVLINYKMITIKQAIDIIDQTLQISGKIAEPDKQAVKNSIKDFLETIIQSPMTDKDRFSRE